MFKSSLTTIIVTFSLSLFFSQSLSAAASDDFVIQVKTDNMGSSSDTQFTIPTTGAGYKYAVDCNNDGLDEVNNFTASYTCNYAVAGTYTIRIKHDNETGNGFPRIYFVGSDDKLKIISLDQWGTSHWTSMYRAFWGTENMLTSAIDSPNLTSVASMDLSYMFYGACIVNPDTSNWNTANVINMSFMFSAYLCYPIGNVVADPNTSNWITTNVTSMQEMFAYQRIANPDTSGWDTGQVTNMQALFADATLANPDTSNWNVENVVNMTGMFQSALSAVPNTSGWITSKVTDMKSMFIYAVLANPDTSNWDVSGVVSMQSMFIGVTLPTIDYDAMLIGFNNQNLFNGTSFHGGGSKFCSFAAQSARANMKATDNWGITDGGLCVPAVAPDLTPATDTGISQSDDLTNDNTPEFDLECTFVGNTLRLYSNKPFIDTFIGTHFCSSIGSQTVAANVPLMVGLQNITYTEQPNGETQSGHSAFLRIAIDTVEPTVPNCSTSPSPAKNGTTVTTTCSGVDQGTVLTIDKMNCTPFSTDSAELVVCVGTVGNGGGEINLSNDIVSVADSAGNINTTATTGLTIDNTPPIGPGLLSAPVNLTNDINDNIVGSCGVDAANGTVNVTTSPTNGFTNLYNMPIDLQANGGFTIFNPNWNQGSYSISFSCTDEAGNGPTIMGLFGPIEIDLSVDAPIINLIATTYLVITGTAEPFATIDVSGAICTNASVVSDVVGEWSCTLTEGLNEGTVINAMATDLAGNVSENTTSIVIAANIAPSFDVFCDLDATDVTGGSSVTVQFPSFVYNMLVGPTNEMSQTYNLSMGIALNGDPDAIIDSVNLTNNGDITLTINIHNNGVATMEITMMDSGGTKVGGQDTTIVQFNVHNYADLNLDPNYINLDLGDMIYKNTFQACRF